MSDNSPDNAPPPGSSWDAPAQPYGQNNPGPYGQPSPNPYSQPDPASFGGQSGVGMHQPPVGGAPGQPASPYGQSQPMTPVPPGPLPHQGYDPYAAQPYPVPPRSNVLAITSLILSIVSWAMCLTVLASIPAVVMGHIALNQLKEPNNNEQGEGLAKAGLWLGYANIAATVGFFLLIVVLSIVAPGE